MNIQRSYYDFTFHDAATVAADGQKLDVKNHNTVTIDIAGTSTSRTVQFKGIGASGTEVSVIGINVSSLATATSTTSTGQLWQFDVTGLVKFFADLTAVAGGNVTIKGRVVE